MPDQISSQPLISSVQKIALYETKNKFFILGSNNDETRFRVLKVDRTDPYELIVVEDAVEYSEKDVQQMLLNAIKTKGSSAALPKSISAFGIVGFVRFLEGYYMILVTKRRQITSIGLHVIYKIEDTSMIYIPHDHYRVPHNDEPRYLKMFQSVDLSSNFYFSYSYDLTHCYQINSVNPSIYSAAVASVSDSFDQSCSMNLNVCGVRYVPNRKFVWNNYLLSEIENKISADWILYIMHGFIGQSNVSIFGRSIYVTLIARRSNRYAGTRFLKRGANYKGDVANEVETEQMIIDVGVSSRAKMRISSFVQMRGSVPSQWSQDITKVVAKPAITFVVSDPFYEIAGSHFNELFCRYGSPIIILNLVKNRERKKHESQLSEQFNSAVSYLNLFLPNAHHIQYISFDMARMNKGKEAKVMDRLAKISRSVISKTGFFLLNGPSVNNKVMDKVHPGNNLQTGIIRVNCVDCLDRTNTAQFALGKCALAHQLYFLGLLDNPTLEFDSDCVRLLEILYEDHGDTLALQYGGSQLVHRIKTYRKTAPWTSQGNDIMQTLSRYYRNTFSDAEKQHAINLFLGLYQPKDNKEPLWDQTNDYYLHHPEAVGEKQMKRVPLTKWWDPNVLECLPLPYDYVKRKFLEVRPDLPTNSEQLDIYAHYHRTDRISIMAECYELKIPHSIRDFMPQCVTNFSPFTVRVGRWIEDTSKCGKTGNIKNPSLTGKSSTCSNTSTSSSSCESEEDDETQPNIRERLQSESDIQQNSEEHIQNIYGITEKKFQIGNKDQNLYEKFEKIDKYSRHFGKNEDLDDYLEMNEKTFNVIMPSIEAKTISFYQRYVDKLSSELVSNEAFSRYKNYADNELFTFRTTVN